MPTPAQTHPGAGSWRGQDRNGGYRTELLPSAAVQGYANVENASAVLLPV